MKYIFCKTLLSILFFTFLFFSCDETYESPYQKIVLEKKASMPGVGRSSAVGFAINGKGYVALGRKDLNSNTLNDCWEYDNQHGTFTLLEPCS